MTCCGFSLFLLFIIVSDLWIYGPLHLTWDGPSVTIEPALQYLLFLLDLKEDIGTKTPLTWAWFSYVSTTMFEYFWISFWSLRSFWVFFEWLTTDGCNFIIIMLVFSPFCIYFSLNCVPVVALDKELLSQYEFVSMCNNSRLLMVLVMFNSREHADHGFEISWFAIVGLGLASKGRKGYIIVSCK